MLSLIGKSDTCTVVIHKTGTVHFLWKWRGSGSQFSPLIFILWLKRPTYVNQP